MKIRQNPSLAVVVVLVLGACAPGSGADAPTPSPVAASDAVPTGGGVAPSPSAQDEAFPTSVFADIDEGAVSDATAAEFQAILDESGEPGMTAAAMSADGTWSGAVGTADGARPMRPNAQLAIGSITKPIVAAQVMQMVEDGALALDDPADRYLPTDLDFDTNGATIRQLLAMRSGIPDYVDLLWDSLSSDRRHHWTPGEVLDLVPTDRLPPDAAFQYSSTNFVLLGLIIERVARRPIAEVLRDGVLSGDGLERLVFQPDERPTEPMAMPGGESTTALQKGGGYLPSLAATSAAYTAGAMASDAASLARWWARFCGGEIVSDASLTEMTAFADGYGLGLTEDTSAHGTTVVGHGGAQVGFAARAMCFVEDGIVVVVMANRDDVGMEVADALAAAARSD